MGRTARFSWDLHFPCSRCLWFIVLVLGRHFRMFRYPFSVWLHCQVLRFGTCQSWCSVSTCAPRYESLLRGGGGELRDILFRVLNDFNNKCQAPKQTMGASHNARAQNGSASPSKHKRKKLKRAQAQGGLHGALSKVFVRHDADDAVLAAKLRNLLEVDARGTLHHGGRAAATVAPAGGGKGARVRKQQEKAQQSFYSDVAKRTPQAKCQAKPTSRRTDVCLTSSLPVICRVRYSISTLL